MKNHAFSVAMDSKDHVRKITLTDEINQKVLFEADLGELVELNLIGASYWN